MKTKLKHRLPLTDEAIASLPPLHRRDDSLVFYGSTKDRPLGDMSPIAVIRKLRGDGSTCGDIVAGCGATAEAKTEEELPSKVVGHAKEVQHIEVTPELVEQVKSKIRDR